MPGLDDERTELRPQVGSAGATARYDERGAGTRCKPARYACLGLARQQALRLGTPDPELRIRENARGPRIATRQRPRRGRKEASAQNAAAAWRVRHVIEGAGFAAVQHVRAPRF